MARLTWEQTAGETVRTARSTRGNTGTRAGPNGETGGFTRQLETETPGGSAHCTGKPRGSGWDSGRTKLPYPRAPPMPSPNSMEADGNGHGAITGRRGPLGRRLERVSVNLVPLLRTSVPTRHDKNICRCFGAPACRVFPDHLNQ